jgi:hydroxypyruvate isomerase
MILCQELGDNGVVINPHHKMGLYDKIKNSIAGLKKLLKILPDDKILVLELLNTVLDHKGYFLNDVHLAVKIIDEVDDSRLKILFDFYHLGLMGYDPIKIIDKYSSYFGYVHIADYPGRHEPGSSRADWPLILKHLDNSGYKGYVGFEFSPESDTDQALRKIKGIWNSL